MADAAQSFATSPQDRLMRRAAAISVAVAVAVLAIKCGAYAITGSTAVLSDAVESVIHVAATLFMAWCAHIAAAPPDAGHPYGHGRIEFLSAGFEGGAVGLAALGIAVLAVHSWWTGHVPKTLDLGLILVATAAVINAVLGWWLLRVGRRIDSPLLVADGHHVLSDVWTSIAVLVGVALMWLVPDDIWRGRLDALLAMVLAAYVLWVAVRLVRGAIAGLLDEADPVLLKRTIDILNAHRSAGWLDIHGLRVRRSGRSVYADFHLVVPKDWSVAKAHDEAERIEELLLRDLNLPGAVMIHLDHNGNPAYEHLTMVTTPLTVGQAVRQDLMHTHVIPAR